MGQGVTCQSCGASTPLPDDLRVPTFACAYCRATLQTAAYAGQAAVSADALMGHINQVVQNKTPVREAVENAPRFQGGSTESRPAKCLNCAAPVMVPLDLQVRQLTCTRCNQVQAINRYISDTERFNLDMQRQLAGNAELKRIQAEGVACGRCGGKNSVPDDGSVQITCTFCKNAILLSDHVDATALARSRLKHGIYAFRDQAIAQGQAQNKKVTYIIVGAIVFVLVLMIAINLIVTHLSHP